MSTVRIALANLPYPESPTRAVDRAVAAIAEAGTRGAQVVCFPEAYVPGYRWPGRTLPAPDARFLESAHAAVAVAAASARVAVVLGTERFTGSCFRLSALVFGADGALLGHQDKVQLDPGEHEEVLYEPGTERKLFELGPLRFGISICHEGFRYPETVRWAARRGAQLVFHPHYSEAEPGGFQPTAYGDARNTFHERSTLCRAAENTCFVATVNCAGAGAPTTSAVAAPDGTLLCHQPYGEAGLLVADLALEQATGLLARRYRPCESA